MKMPVTLSVTQLNTYIKSLFDGDENLSSIFVCGEISNFTNHYKSGHWYLSLKDEKCVVRAVMFAPNARRVRFLPQDGMRVIVRGRVSAYEATGQYQLYIEDMQPDGLGALNLAYEQLKNRLEAEGLFSPARKKPLPLYPESIAVITSETGAAVHDVCTILARRYPLAQVVLCPVLVQGERAVPQMIEAIQACNRLRCADLIILGRGGGSLEDLWAFNEEALARAVAASEIPVISAVGHETDFTICDFVADLRAPTPSAAAELAVPDKMELKAKLEFQRSMLRQSMESVLDTDWSRLAEMVSRRVMQEPLEQISIRRMKLDALSNTLLEEATEIVRGKKQRFSQASGLLDTLSPLKVLSRGYAVVRGQGGQTVRSAGQVSVGDHLGVQFVSGRLTCRVEEKEE